MAFPLFPSNTDSAELYPLGQVSIEGSIVEDAIDGSGNTYHKWATPGGQTSSPSVPVINSLLSTDALAPLSANQGRVLANAIPPGGWTELNTTRINGGARTTTRGTYAAPLTGANAFAALDYRLIVANGTTTTLPNPVTYPGRTIEIKKAGPAGTAAYSGLVDGAANAAYTMANLNENITLYSDGATWIRS